MTAAATARPFNQLSDDEVREQTRHLSDAQILQMTDSGRMGPGIVGEAVYKRGQWITKGTDGGRFGPAITDPDYAAKQAAKRKAERAETDRVIADEEENERFGDGEQSEGELRAAVDPWSFVTLSGAKMLAQKAGISYQPRIKRAELVDLLKAAYVVPPAPPENPDADDED
jgi:hypothetical protein